MPSCSRQKELTIITCRLNYERRVIRHDGFINEGGKHKFGTQDSGHKVYYLSKLLSSKNIPVQQGFAKPNKSVLNNISSLVEITSCYGQDDGIDQVLYS